MNEDLDRRGLLDATLVCNLAEFGRTPRVNPAGGRDHWPQCFTVGFAGGGVKGGRVVGASDPIGAVPAEGDAFDLPVVVYRTAADQRKVTLAVTKAGKAWTVSPKGP